MINFDNGEACFDDSCSPGKKPFGDCEYWVVVDSSYIEEISPAAADFLVEKDLVHSVLVKNDHFNPVNGKSSDRMILVTNDAGNTRLSGEFCDHSESSKEG